MKKWILLFMALLILAVMISDNALAQCSICTKTAQQLGEKPAKGLNAGILYLAAAPYAIICYIAYRWWKNYKKS